MNALTDVLIYLVIIGGAAGIAYGLISGIRRMIHKIHIANARLIWRVVARHRRQSNGSLL